ncbi:MAG: DUF4397 domain-containing protein [Actinomycetota bacterium]
MTARKSLARAIAIAVTAASLLTIAGPASAGADTRATVFVVHGIPGVKVDVCIGGIGEVASGLSYAERFKKLLDAGSYSLKVRTASKGECKGAVVTKAPLTVAALDNVTAVVRYVDGKPGITKFTNDVSPTAPGEIRFAAAHMMKSGPVDVWANGEIAITSVARGATSEIVLPADVQYGVWGTDSGETTPIVGPRVIDNTGEGQAFTFIMVGTKVANSRLVIFKQPVVA